MTRILGMKINRKNIFIKEHGLESKDKMILAFGVGGKRLDKE